MAYQAKAAQERSLTPAGRKYHPSPSITNISYGNRRKVFGTICTAERSWPGRDFSSCSRKRERDRYSGAGRYERQAEERWDYRNGYYERDFLTRFGSIRLRIARTRQKNFLPPELERFQRRAPELTMLVREAFLRGLSTRQVGRVIATLTDKPISAQSVSRLTRGLDEAVRRFHQASLKDEWAYLFLDGVSLRVRRPAPFLRMICAMASSNSEDCWN